MIFLLCATCSNATLERLLQPVEACEDRPVFSSRWQTLLTAFHDQYADKIVTVS